MINEIPPNYSYSGQELDLFRQVKNWKSYFKSLIVPYLGENVLEVGAGKGGTTEMFIDPSFKHWVSIEPDKVLFEELCQNKALFAYGNFQADQFTIDELPENSLFNIILYIDVLEHIEKDSEEISKATKHLLPGGRLIVLSPAYQFFFTPFDEAVGHFRRYNKESLHQCIPDSLQCIDVKYIDSVGCLLSLGNKLLLKKSIPTTKQLAFWDQHIIPVSRKVDKLIHYKVGKTILGIWQKQ